MTRRRSMGRSPNTRTVRFGLAVFGLASLVSSVSWAQYSQKTTNGGQAYVAECLLSGVPVPAKFNYEDEWHNRPGSTWEYHGVQEITFAGEDYQIAEVFSYQTSDGVCIALPRSRFPDGQTSPDAGPPEEVELLGVICQGNLTARACFFDAEDIDPNEDVYFGDPTPGTQSFVGGVDITTDRCTSCHLGENVFLTHAASALADVPNRLANDWVIPIIPDNPSSPWLDNVGPYPFDSSDLDSCLLCHQVSRPGGRFPLVSTQTTTYCDRILRTAYGWTMPTPGGVPAPGGEPPYDILDAACRTAPPPELNPPEQMMSFDGPAENFWSPTPGPLTDVSDNTTQGEASMSVDSSGYVWLDSMSFSTWDLPYVGTEVQLDVFVPPGQPNPDWFGFAQLFATIPSAQVTNSFVGHVELSPLGTGWSTVSFLLPPEVHSALQEEHADVRFSLAVNTPYNAPSLLLDNMQFAGALSEPAAVPALMTKYNFERGGDWTDVEGAVVGSSTSDDVAFLGNQSLRVDLDGASDGRVFRAPMTGPSPGDTVSFRVFIPSGTPISAVQPYVQDDDYNWHHTWNPNLPQDGWMTVTAVVPEDAPVPIREIGVKVYLSQPHTGPFYLDAIQW